MAFSWWYKEIIPEILASTPKSARKNMKNSTIAFFHREQSAHQFSKQVIGQFPWKKMLNIDPNRRFDVTSRWHALHKQGVSSAIHLLSCGINRENSFWCFLCTFWSASDRSSSQVPTFHDFSPISTCFSLQMLRFLGPKFWPREFIVGKTSEVCFSANRNKNLKKLGL